ncbi:hypothetical protein BJ875DRAFT_56348 [Amylocarpus encephaloides]|uniref:PSI domain-containing protein n=1 Tax=Amylocarpus encephaloides TaxID=45428 RepID=A0A9P7YR74_9HELO|nr:hypothetical protein BJ875DRAFT_56348 [Amylocarpus encephaloides]
MQHNRDADSGQDFDDMLRVCWPHQDCSSCLKQGSCGWCPESSTCVPNTSNIQIFAPVFNNKMCPLSSERWEFRTRPFGCHVSTITVFTCIVSVFATVVMLASLAGLNKLRPKVQAKWNGRPTGCWKVWKYYEPGWWKILIPRLVDINGDDESTRPLLENRV